IFIGFPEVKETILYSFIHAPEHINTLFLGVIDISGKSLFLSLLAALATYFQLHVSSNSNKVPSPSASSFGDNLTISMQKQMKYFFPLLMFFISYKISGVIGLYFLTTNLFSALQELYVKRHLKTVQV
ncbi:YidC/Oxa1 family membrane protein insertase, partial [Candidatus Parcubacteria bacterium]|nr:YidC/Oxa1 family membrane protein insertase [Candidatus Parcubacteria bacterium]